VEAEEREDHLYVRLSGEIDLSNAHEVALAIEAAVPNSAGAVLLDLTETSYIDSTGVSLVLRLAERLRSGRRKLRVLAPPGTPVRAVLELAGVPALVPLLEG
jgi:anti-sigma B factor antagonist